MEFAPPSPSRTSPGRVFLQAKKDTVGAKKRDPINNDL